MGFVKEIVQLLVQSYLTKSSSFQLDTKRKIAEAFTQLSSNLNINYLRQFILAELLKMFTTLSKEILNNHIKKKHALVLASSELGLMLPAIAVLCTPLYIPSSNEEQQNVTNEYVQDNEEEYIEEQGPATKHKKRFGKRSKKEKRTQ